MSNLSLPRKHTLKVKWAPLYYYPIVGSRDCVTVALIAVSDEGKSLIIEANKLSNLNCLFGDAGKQHILFVRMAIECLREQAKTMKAEVFSGDVGLGTAFSIGEPVRGSGFDIKSIATAWISKVSTMHISEARPLVSEQAIDAPLAAQPISETRIIPAIRKEIEVFNPTLAVNFDADFHPKGRNLAVKMGYRGENIVANFDRVTLNRPNLTLDRIRSKLWLLVEHREQTQHEKKDRSHEMLVIPSARIDPVAEESHALFISRACQDIEAEADRQEIRFRQFASAEEAARHIYSMEGTGRPFVVTPD